MVKPFIINILFLLVILSISNEHPHLKSVKNEKSESAKTSKPTKKPQEYYENLIEKGLRLDNLTRGNPPLPYYEKIDYKKDKIKRKRFLQNLKKTSNLRKLAETQTLENVGFVNLFKKVNYAYKFLLSNVKKQESKFILYPYPFSYKERNEEGVEEEKQVENGGVFALNQSQLEGGKFDYLVNMSSVEIKKAKGLYDIDIGIMSLVYEFNGRETDLFTEASAYCEYFVNTLSKISSCLNGKKAYLEYKQRYPTKGAVLRVSNEDLLNNTLYDSQTKQLKVSLLIFSDYLTGNEETIFDNYLRAEEIEVIKEFRNLGGHIVASGKSGYLLEKMGIIPDDTYDTSFTLHTKDRNYLNNIVGCGDIYGRTPEEQPDYFKQLICLKYPNQTYLSQTFTMKSIPSNFDSLIIYENKEKNLFKKIDGRDSMINDEDATYHYILTSKEETGKGRIMIINGNPIQEKNYIDNFRNMLLYCMTKSIIYDLKIQFSATDSEEDDLPIPAGEEGVQLKTSFKFYNLDDRDLSDISVDILFVPKIEIVDNSISEGCSIVEDSTKYQDLSVIGLNTSRYLNCRKDSLEKLSNFVKGFKLEFTDYTVTQRLYDIPLMYSFIYYKDGDEEIINTPGMFYAQAEVAALLRATLNKDPPSTYPILGQGIFFDLSLNIENKEKTEAKDVKFVSVIPLIGPIYDGSDESAVAHLIPLYEDYYEKHNYSYPWIDYENDRGIDYIDYAEVAGKGVCYVSDFDTPIKVGRRLRSELEDEVENLFHFNGTITLDDNAGLTKTANPNSLMRQIYFADNEKFYETATARTSLFIDTAKDAGAEAMYGGSIPEKLKDPHHPTRAKTKYGFVRLDTFFYPSSFGQYQYPIGLNDSVLISLDKYNQSHIEKTGTKLGDVQKKIIIPGHYDSTRPKLDRLKENEYSNSMREYLHIKQYDPTDPAQFAELKSLTNETLKLSHFMIPFADSNYIQKAGSIDGFIENPDGSGYMEEYPSVKFVYGFDIDLVIPPEKSRLGGMVEVFLGNDVNFNITDPIEQDSVTLSADNVAFYKIEYNETENKISAYFKRGLMPNENYGLPSKCRVFIENLNRREDFDVTLKLYNLKYDFSVENFENLVHEEDWTMRAIYRSFFSLPCIIMENTLNRKSSFSEEVSTSMFEYELMNPYARYGGYYQELTKHTTVYGFGESHHRADPGFQSTSSGFSLLGNIGTSAIPAAEFVEHGILFIPAVVSTSRIEWTDIWGRKWAQSLRSIYPDIPPVPPGPLNFIMTTTFEMITNDAEQKRVLEWQSDESVYIWIQMKIKNTYKLYWEPTICLENQKPYIKGVEKVYRTPAFEDFTEDLEGVDDTYDVNLGFSSVYGVCYDENSYIGGEKITSSILTEMKNMMSCSATEDAELMSQCSKRADELRLPKLKKKPDNTVDNTPNENWNYSPLIESYYPDGYISSNKMWQLTKEEDYYDDSFFKGYPFHLDDCIPSVDNGNRKPHDIIQFPIFKGLGYSITYDRNYAIKKFPLYKGWWSDQLQSKDHTLLAGQQKVNQISVNETRSLIDDSNWINIRDLNYKDTTQKASPGKIRNLYVCMFNQYRVKVEPGQRKYAYLSNVYQNNVVPILPDLKEDDPRYTSYDCTGENAYQYSNYNISKVDNRVYTGNDRDWLYFAAGLRGNAKENINVILKLDPINESLFEGVTKVQDGGRFIYWVPPNGPNSYQYYDGNINTVISKRVDLTLNHRMIPTDLYTFNSYGYQLFTIEDKREEKREYTMNSYMNSHGYGDATVTVYVGGTDATSCKVNPNEFTYVKITFYNNAGFDWEMRDDGIELDEGGYGLKLNAIQMMSDKVTAVQYPKKYNFMSYIIPDEIKRYVTLSPSQHVIDLSPQFFDLTFNNIKTIKDAFEGDYFYCLNVSNDFPEEYMGKLWEIKMVINEEYFKTLPGVNDPTGIHDYHLTIPSIKFGVPIRSGKYKNKVFYKLGEANDMIIKYKLHKNFKYLGAKILKEDDLEKLSQAVSDKKVHFEKLLEVWDSINHYPEKDRLIEVTSSPKDSFYQYMTVNLSKAFPVFPYEDEEPPAPYVSRIYVLVKTFAENIPFGNKNLLSGSQIFFNDSRKVKMQNVEYPSSISCYASGPSFYPEFETKIIKYNDSSSDYYEVEKQEIFEGDTQTLRLTLSTTNEGTSDAFTPAFSVGVNPHATYIPSEEDGEFLIIRDNGIVNNMRMISIKYNGKVIAGTVQKFDLKFEMQFGEKKEFDSRRRLAEASNKSIKLVESLNITLCLSDVACHEGDTNFGRQITEKDFKIVYSSEQRAVGSISLTCVNSRNESFPKYVLTASIDSILSEYSSNGILYSFQRKIEGRDSHYVELALIPENVYIDEPFKEGEVEEAKGYKISYRVVGYLEDGRTLDSLNKNTVNYSYKIAEPEPEIKKEAKLVEEEPKQEEELEEDSKKKGLPLYVIIIIIISSLVILCIVGLLIWKIGCKKKVVPIVEEDNVIRPTQTQKFDELNLESKTYRRGIKNRKHVDVKVIQFDSQKI